VKDIDAQKGTKKPKHASNEEKRLLHPPINARAQVILSIPLENLSASTRMHPVLENAKGGEVAEGVDEVEGVVQER